MYCRPFYLSFLLFLIIGPNVYGDVLRLANFDEKIDVKLIEVNDEFVKVKIPQNEIGSMSVDSVKEGKYTDTVFVSVNGRECKVVCKIVQMAKEPPSVTLEIPREKVSGIQIDFPESSGSGPLPVDTEKLKEEIMKELMLKFEKKQKLDGAALEEKLKEELRVEFEKKKVFEDEIYNEKDLGEVKGRMLFKGEPLPGCRVKIVLLNRWGWNIMGGFKEGIRFETVTGESGIYRFKKVPPGGYKLYWKRPAETSWIRKLKMEPDIFVEPGETHYLPDRETNVRTVN